MLTGGGYPDLFADQVAGGIGGFKTALELLGVIDSATMPAPLALLSDADRDAIRAILVEVDLLS